MTDRQRFIVACLLIGSGLLVFGYLTADQWLGFASSVLGSAG